jgi:glycosyltransferase involved in cell wall biosynthesis
MDRHCLIIALPFPPDGPVGASIRTVSFCRHLPAFGWEPTVLSGPYVGPRHPERPSVPRLGGIGHERAAGLHPAGWRDWVRPLLLPDRYLAWVPQAVQDGLAWLRHHPDAVLISEGPTHAAHLVAWWLKRQTQRPWLADFADPWIGNPFHPRRPWPLARIERTLERSVLRSADAVVTASPANLPHLQHIGGKSVAVIENGFDAGLIGDTGDEPYQPGPELLLRHVGSLYGPRTLAPLLTSLGRLESGGRPCRLEQIGGDRLDDPRCHWGAAVPGPEAQALIRQADVLVLVPGADYALPTKLYEYAASGRPILNLGSADGEAARWIAAHGAGVTIPPDDQEAIGRQLQEWSRLPSVPGTGLGPDRLAAYERRHLTGKLARILDNLV